MSNHDQQTAYGAAYRDAHREEKRAYGVVYAAAHREERRACSAAYYATNRGAIKEKRAKEFAEFREWLQILRTNNGCEDCETHEGLLEHHHVDPATKLYNVSEMYHHSLHALEDELEKCDVLCHSCHTKRHWEMRAA